jgi:hypothetical protein
MRWGTQDGPIQATTQKRAELKSIRKLLAKMTWLPA